MNQDDPAARKRITLSLAQYLRRKVDPDMNGLWTFHGDPAYDDIVYYMLQVLHLDGLDSTLLNVRFIWARATQGLGAVEALLQDYQHARSAVSSAKYSDLKDHLQVLKPSQALLPSHTRITQYTALQLRCASQHGRRSCGYWQSTESWLAPTRLPWPPFRTSASS